MKSTMFFGRKVSGNCERGLYNHKPYIVMATHPDHLTVMIKYRNDWFVKSVKSGSELYDFITRKRLSLSEKSAESLMAHERVKKKKSQAVGGAGENLQYKQVTVYAYWANLENSKSGNASVVASNCYV